MDKIIEYFQDNPLYFWIAVALVAVIVILIIVAIACGVHKSRKKKRAAEEAATAAASADLPAETADGSEAAPQAAQPEGPEEVPYIAPAQAAEEVPEQPAAEESAPSDAWEEAPANIGAQVPEEKEEPAPAEQPAPTEEEVQTEASDGPAPSAAPAVEEKQAEPEEPAPEEKPAQEETGEERAANARIRRAEKIADSKIEKKQSPAKQAKAAKADDKPAPAPAKAEDEEKRSAYAGKWVIVRNPDDSYHFELRASNGEMLLSSIDYTSLAGAKNGIRTHKTNIQKDHIVISQNKKGQFFFKLLNGSKQLLCTGETYPSKSGCESAVDSVKRFAETAVVTVQEDDEE